MMRVVADFGAIEHRPVQVDQGPDVQVAQGYKEYEDMPIVVEGRVNAKAEGHDEGQEHREGKEEQGTRTGCQTAEVPKVAYQSHQKEHSIDAEHHCCKDQKYDECTCHSLVNLAWR